jgi:hypothetical protein
MQLPPVSVQACTVRSDYSAVTYTKVTLHYTYGKEIGYGIRVNKDTSSSCAIYFYIAEIRRRFCPVGGGLLEATHAARQAARFLLEERAF